MGWKPKPQTVGLAMIVRNNEEIVGRALGSAIEHIDYLTVVDTGSTDGTMELVNEALALVPGELHQREWKFSGHNRTELLALARGTADYLLLLDADHQLLVEDDLPHLTSPVYMLRERYGSLDQRMPRLIRGDREWCYIGAAHEYLADANEREPLDEWFVVHHGDGRSSNEKLTVALGELEQAFASDPTDARTVFYLAQTHRELGDVDKAIFYFRLRCGMGGFDEERYYARYQLGCLLATHVSFEQGADELLLAWKERPARIESLRALANSANAVADQAEAPDDLLFVHRDLYTG